MKRMERKGVLDGQAMVRVGKTNGLVQVIYAEDSDNPITLKKADCPPYVQKGEFRVRIDPKEMQILSMAPWVGIYDMKFKAFATENENDPPAPKQYDGKYGAYLGFTALFTVVEKGMEGLSGSKFYSYKFDNDHGNAATWGKGRGTEDLEELLEIAIGITPEEDIKFQDNLLPDLQKTGIRRGKVFKGNFKEGYVASIMANPNQPLTADEDEEDWEKLHQSDLPVEDKLPESAGSGTPPWKEEDDFA